MEANVDNLKLTNALMKARQDYLAKDLDVEAWEHSYEMLQKVFEKPEHLHPLVVRWLQDMRHTYANKAMKYPEVAAVHDNNIFITDQKLDYVRNCIEIVAAIREKQR